ncbi:MAG: hypothetical protein QXL57_08075 [Candidatus Bathyarchaeia archaeon]
MEKRKKLITILSAAIIVTAIFAPLLIVKNVAAADPTDWYMTVNGVLDSDTYLLYPYDSENLKVGLSKFGELIDSNNNVGLEYAGARDPFAAPVGSSIDEGKLPKKVWINGWYIDIRYVHEDWGSRNIWAGALFADKSDYGKNWIRVDNNYTYPYHPVTEAQESFDDKGLELDDDLEPIPGLVNGGRKTNGTAVTEPITVLYDGPRLFVAKSETHIYDWNEEINDNLHLVDVILTIMFNKVKKEVVVIKDVKFIEQAKYVIADLTITVPDDDNGEEEITIPQAILIQFSNREEWDLGAKNVAGTTDYSSYVHFYTAGTAPQDAEEEGQSTVYNEDWTLLPTLPAGVKYKDIEINAWGSEPGASGTYDVAQIISNDKAYVGWHAFWPSLSDWSADAARGTTKTWYRAMKADDPHWINSYSSSEPFLSPLIVGEWDFILSDKEDVYGSVNIGRQFRGVSVYGVTDLHDGDDANMGARHDDVLDTEVKYQLDEVFNPWDLLSAVHKSTRRWVEWKEADASTTFTTSHAPVVEVDDDGWDDYCVFSERVFDLTENELEARVGYNWMGQDTYTVTYNEDGTMTISGLDAYHEYKILYSTQPVWGDMGTIELTEDFNTFDSVSPGDSVTFEYSTSYLFDADPLGVIHGFNFTVAMEITVKDTVSDDFTESLDNPCLDGVHSNFKVFRGETYYNDYYFWDNVTYNGDNVVVTCVTLDPTMLTWNITSPEETVHIAILDILLYLASEISYNYTTEELNVTFTPYMGYLYMEYMGGRYEWGIVGRDAHSVDSAGLSMVSAAFKNKQVEYGLAGADMYDPLPYNQMPWVMSKIGADDEWTDYYYSGTDYRTALRDDWCTTWPISSSNMIGIGGPLANLLAYYGNDFMMTIFGLSYETTYGDFTDYADWEKVIIPLTCWDITKTQTYSSSNETGYAVISTYKDINGTVLFLVWGHWGRDTYYASKWFHEEGIYQLQEAPEGLTAIILKITYESTDEGYKPTGYSIVECLGTISETEWTHNRETKGGIHDP